MSIGLTPPQKRLLDFIKARIKATGGVAPSYGEMAEHMELASRSSAFRLVEELIARGRVRRERGMHRGLEVIDDSNDPFDVAREALARVGAEPTADAVVRIGMALQTEARNAP